MTSSIIKAAGSVIVGGPASHLQPQPPIERIPVATTYLIPPGRLGIFVRNREDDGPGLLLSLIQHLSPLSSIAAPGDILVHVNWHLLNRIEDIPRILSLERPNEVGILRTDRGQSSPSNSPHITARFYWAPPGKLGLRLDMQKRIVKILPWSPLKNALNVGQQLVCIGVVDLRHRTTNEAIEMLVGNEKYRRLLGFQDRILSEHPAIQQLQDQTIFGIPSAQLHTSQPHNGTVSPVKESKKVSKQSEVTSQSKAPTLIPAVESRQQIKNDDTKPKEGHPITKSADSSRPSPTKAPTPVGSSNDESRNKNDSNKFQKNRLSKRRLPLSSHFSGASTSTDLNKNRSQHRNDGKKMHESESPHNYDKSRPTGSQTAKLRPLERDLCPSPPNEPSLTGETPAIVAKQKLPTEQAAAVASGAWRGFQQAAENQRKSFQARINAKIDMPVEDRRNRDASKDGEVEDSDLTWIRDGGRKAKTKAQNAVSPRDSFGSSVERQIGGNKAKGNLIVTKRNCSIGDSQGIEKKKYLSHQIKDKIAWAYELHASILELKSLMELSCESPLAQKALSTLILGQQTELDQLFISMSRTSGLTDFEQDLIAWVKFESEPMKGNPDSDDAAGTASSIGSALPEAIVDFMRHWRIRYWSWKHNTCSEMEEVISFLTLLGFPWGKKPQRAFEGEGEETKSLKERATSKTVVAPVKEISRKRRRDGVDVRRASRKQHIEDTNHHSLIDSEEAGEDDRAFEIDDSDYEPEDHEGASESSENVANKKPRRLKATDPYEKQNQGEEKSRSEKSGFEPKVGESKRKGEGSHRKTEHERVEDDNCNIM